MSDKLLYLHVILQLRELTGAHGSSRELSEIQGKLSTHKYVQLGAPGGQVCTIGGSRGLPGAPGSSRELQKQCTGILFYLASPKSAKITNLVI